MSAILPTLYLISHPHRNHPYPPSSVVSSSSRFFSHPTHRFTPHPPSLLYLLPRPTLHLPARFLSTSPATASKALDYLPLISARVAHLLPRLSRLVRDHHLPRSPSSFSLSFFFFFLLLLFFLFFPLFLSSLFSRRSFVSSSILTIHPDDSLPTRWLDSFISLVPFLPITPRDSRYV